MKKVIFLSMIVCAISVGCSNNEEYTKESQEAISFNSLRDKVQTRAANDSADNYYAYAIIDGYTDWYFNTEVNTTTGATDYYWPQGATLDFYSFCPVPTADNIVVGTTTPGTEIPITYTVPTTADQDFTIATPALDKSGPNPVHLAFNHMLSKISIKVELVDTLTSSFTLASGWTSELSMLYTSATTDAVTAVAATNATGWTLPSTAPTSLTTYSSDSTFIVMPQAVAGNTLRIMGVTINTNPGGEKYFEGPLELITFSSTNITNITDFEAGMQYNFVITIGGTSHGGTDNEPIFNGKISFTSTVADWGGPTSIAVTQP